VLDLDVFSSVQKGRRQTLGKHYFNTVAYQTVGNYLCDGLLLNVIHFYMLPSDSFSGADNDFARWRTA
jgi:hypothetical protein